jgi:phosphatidylglycerophosphate synthase
VHEVLNAASARPIGQQLAAAVGAQLALLAALFAGLGLGAWSLAGLAYAVGLCALLGAAARRARVRTLGPADLVTLARAALVAGVTALVADGLGPGDPSVVALVVLVVLATVALTLDAVDGRVARRTGTASALGARFDMEVDSFLVLVLSVHVASLLGPWVLAIGAMRYAFVAASWAMPWMRASLPPRYTAKLVAAVQGITLIVASAEVLPHALAATLVGVGLGLLICSFGRDVRWLRRHAGRSPVVDGHARPGPRHVVAHPSVSHTGNHYRTASPGGEGHDVGSSARSPRGAPCPACPTGRACPPIRRGDDNRGRHAGVISVRAVVTPSSRVETRSSCTRSRASSLSRTTTCPSWRCPPRSPMRWA